MKDIQSDNLNHFMEIADHLAIGIALVNMDGQIIYANDADCLFLGYSKEELKGMHFSVFTHEDDLTVDLALFQELLEGKRKAYNIDKRYIRKDGTVIWGHLNVSLMFDESSNQELVVVTCDNITDKKKIEEALVKSESMLNVIASTVTDSIFCKDINRRYTYVNKAMAKLLDCNEQDIIGKRPEEIFGHDAAQIIKEVDDLTFDGQKVDVVKSLTVNDKIYYFHTVQAPMEMKDGKVISINGIVRDVTENIKVQEEKSLLETELHQLHKMEAISTLTGGIAHDFNNILAIIIGNAELAKMYISKDSPACKNINHLVNASNRAKKLVKRLLTFCREEKGEKRPLHLCILIEEGMKTLRSTIPKTVEIDVKIPEKCKKDISECLMIDADPVQFHQLLMNLCINAVDAMREIGTLSVSLDEITITDDTPLKRPSLDVGTYEYLTISDTGHGIQPELIEKIFNPFFTTKEVGKGTGIGLSVVQGIIKNHGGEIYVESIPGEGTTFHMYFPAIEPKKVTSGKQSALNTNIPTGNERILLVDDEEMLVHVEKRMLEHLGYEITPKTSSIEALELFRDDPHCFDLVITDQSMPNMSGYELASKMLQANPEIPIILCTGYSSKIDKDKALEIGIREFLLKPIDRDEIAVLIRKVLE